VEPFSRRHGYSPRDAEITVREDAPSGLRAKLLDTAQQYFSPKDLRAIVCAALSQLPDRNNWSDGNVSSETHGLVEDAEWPYIYDIIERLAGRIAIQAPGRGKAFETEINDYFRTAGIGWQLIDGRIETRGPAAFETTVRGATKALADAGLPTASQEIREALLDLSKRPDPDLTGAIHHGMGALEATAKAVSGDTKLEVGKITKTGLFPKPLDTVVEKAWGYASDKGRHIREGPPPDRADVELVVSLAAALATYLVTKVKPKH
jgi:hypothetical protein